MKLSSWLIIAGTGRNTGKTSLACALIHKYRDKKPVAVKISPHFHPLDEEEQVLCKNDDFVIVREKRLNSKDSSRMLQAGASVSFYVQVKDECLEKMFTELQKHIPAGALVVVESGGLRRLIKPGLFILMVSGDKKATASKKDRLPDPDAKISLDEIPSFLNSVEFREDKWYLQ